MSDRELLEWAAKAAGLSVRWNAQWKCFFRDARPVKKSCSAWLPWNPREDDGDAFRLAVKLKMTVQTTNQSATAYWEAMVDPNWITVAITAGCDARAATRQAIVLAAAKAGRGD